MGAGTVRYAGRPLPAAQTAEKSIPVSEANKRWASVPVARYALWNRDTESWHFFEVHRPDDGKWSGWTFLAKLSGGNREKVPQAEMELPMSHIAKDPAEAMKDYGKNTNTCSKCHTELTDPKSLKIGIGPDCKKYYESEHSLKF